MKNSAVPQQGSVWSNIGKFMVAIFLLLLVIGFLFPAPESACIGRVKITGEIVYDAPEPLFGESAANTPEDIGEHLRGADESENAEVILIEINSPGGSSAASKEIYDSIKELKKPVLVYMTEVAASGGYYVAAAGDYVIAHPNSITGSIGARATLLNYESLFEKLGLREESIKSGELKDIGAGYRNITERERSLLQGIVDETFGIFRKDVEESRRGKLDLKLFNEAMDARILSASQAKRIGLVDEVAGMRRVLEKATEMAEGAENGEGNGNGIASAAGPAASGAGKAALPICDFGGQQGFSVFSGLSAGIGKEIASGLISGMREKRVNLEYS